MVEEAKPIKTEIIDNPDGTKIYKYIYENIIDREYQSKIELLDKFKRPIYIEYFEDDNFNKKKSVCEINYEIDNNYKMFSKYFVYPIDEFFLSRIEVGKIYNKSFFPKERIFYKDNNFEIIQKKVRIEQNNDGTTVNKIVNNEIVEGHYQSIIEKFDNQNRLVLSECFTDRCFKNLISTHKFVYFNDNKYKLYVDFTKKFYKYPYLSRIEVGTLIDKEFISNEITFYKKKNFTDIICKKNINRKIDGFIVEQISREEPDNNGWLSSIEYYNNNNQYLSGEYYYDKNFKKLGLKETHEYGDDNSYTRYCIWEKPKEDGLLSMIEYFDNKHNYIKGKYYIDKNFSVQKLIQ